MNELLLSLSRFDPSALPRGVKRAMFFFVDTVLVPASLFGACALRYGTMSPDVSPIDPLFPMMLFVGLGTVWFTRLPMIKLKALETRAIAKIGFASALLALFAIALSYLLKIPAPRSVPLIFGAVFFGAAVLYRIGALYLLGYLRDRTQDRQNVIIYGAGAAGRQLAAALQQSSEARPVAFVDDRRHVQAMMVAGLEVMAPSKLEKLVRKYDVHRILLALPTISKSRRAEILKTLATLNGVEVQVLPSVISLMANERLTDALRSVTPDEFLGRDRVDLDIPEIAGAYAGRNILVTGAGGSIGSELCRQLVECGPSSITLFEVSEYNLYEIDRTLRPVAEAAGVAITARLGSVTDRARVAQVMAEERIEIVLHAAAYKHVPLVEQNELPGVFNNVMGTRIVAEEAETAQVERFILVSTDKAVRPTNIMGATKRMAEMLVQDMQIRAAVPKFSMVRFGNVLGSSGSVLPLFQQQIAKGGPVTVTHPEVTRFFMTIPEAARLVLLAGAYAEGGDVFVLDMGKPRKIIDIARQMIALSGRKAQDGDGDQDDIAIEITGLRPGEKLYEELLIDDDRLMPTPHPKILRAQDAPLSRIEIAAMLREIQAALDAADVTRLRSLIRARVTGYHDARIDQQPLAG